MDVIHEFVQLHSPLIKGYAVLSGEDFDYKFQRHSSTFVNVVRFVTSPKQIPPSSVLSKFSRRARCLQFLLHLSTYFEFRRFFFPNNWNFLVLITHFWPFDVVLEFFQLDKPLIKAYAKSPWFNDIQCHLFSDVASLYGRDRPREITCPLICCIRIYLK